MPPGIAPRFSSARWRGGRGGKEDLERGSVKQTPKLVRVLGWLFSSGGFYPSHTMATIQAYYRAAG